MFTNRRLRRARRSRYAKLIKGFKDVGRYAAPSVLLMLMGCVPSPNLVGVSPDGRHLIVPVNQAGVSVLLNQPSQLVLIDLKTNQVRALEHTTTEGPFWIMTAGDVVVLNSFTDDLKKPLVTVLRDGRAITIDNALFPALSDDGRYLVYAGVGNNRDKVGQLRRLDIKSGQTQDLNVAGTAPDISPDGKRVLFVSRTAAAGAETWKLETIAIDGTGRKAIADIDPDTGGSFFYPRWADNRSVVYRTRTAQSPHDGELFIADLEGHVEQVTDNDLEDAFPQFAGRDRLVYLSHPPDQPLVHNDKLHAVPVWVAERKDGKWRHRALGIDAYSFTIVGDQIIYMTPTAEGNALNIYRAPLANPKQTTDLGGLIHQKVENLPQAVKLKD